MLDQIYAQAADLCLAEGVACDDSPHGPIRRWVAANVKYRPGTEFFIVTGIAAAMADRLAQREGYKNAIDRAVALTDWNQSA
jgi:hypothetical protein